LSITLTGFREAVQAELQVDIGIDFVPGVLVGPVEGRPLGCVWCAGKKEADDNVGDEIIEVHVRAFQAVVLPQDPTVPVDPGPLEELADQIVAALKDKQTAFGPWFTRITELELDMETQGLEITLIGRQENQFLLGG
jgi:hypothetical protein